jgi:glycosyltransferase involved in cell wall biosynthesis
MPHEQIYNAYTLADIFLSLYDMSNVGNPLWESINMGLCIVTLDTGDTGEVIRDRVNGRLIAPDADDGVIARRVSEALAELVENPAERKRLAQGAREFGRRSLWTWEERLQAELDAISGLVRTRAPT